jgi:hypothetical protein
MYNAKTQGRHQNPALSAQIAGAKRTYRPVQIRMLIVTGTATSPLYNIEILQIPLQYFSEMSQSCLLLR